MDTVLICDSDVSPNLRRTVEQLIDDGSIASAVYRRATESTNTDAVSAVQSGAVADTMLPRLYLTDQQTAGRGRQGNSWISDVGSLTFSLVVDFDLANPSAAFLSPAIGVAIARAIEFLCAPCRVALKWPNDICLLWSPKPGSSPELRKLGGVLIETSVGGGRKPVIGIGLNLNRTPQLDAPVHTPPASLSDLTARTVSRSDLLAAVVDSITDALEELDVAVASLIDQYRSRCALTGKDLSLIRNGELVTGFCTGITDDGSLELVSGGHRRTFRSGEVQRVRSV
ncbi:MAG: biotin--[acetyl-CoA-carboxylase] ligase [Planctomycetales bacterium]|nr:biotin--[acetyl-CoA-carboxylase] ligase [Planctomycetales bacterium]